MQFVIKDVGGKALRQMATRPPSKQEVAEIVQEILSEHGKLLGTPRNEKGSLILTFVGDDKISRSS